MQSGEQKMLVNSPTKLNSARNFEKLRRKLFFFQDFFLSNIISDFMQEKEREVLLGLTFNQHRKPIENCG